MHFHPQLEYLKWSQCARLTICGFTKRSVGQSTGKAEKAGETENRASSGALTQVHGEAGITRRDTAFGCGGG